METKLTLTVCAIIHKIKEKGGGTRGKRSNGVFRHIQCYFSPKQMLIFILFHVPSQTVCFVAPHIQMSKVKEVPTP